jgi:addiction module RelB/DinJ family antitoxin
MSTTDITIPIDTKLKEQLQQLTTALGIDVTTYFTLCAKQGVQNNALPFSPYLQDNEKDSNTQILKAKDEPVPDIRNLSHIHPLNRKRVQILAEHIAKNPAVENIRIFGSSVRKDCSDASDVDIYVELNKEIPKHELIQAFFDFPYDLWTNFSVDKHLYDEIMNTSVLIYRKEKKRD